MSGDPICFVIVKFIHLIPWLHFFLTLTICNLYSRSQSCVGSKVKAEMTNGKCTHICTHREELWLKVRLKKKIQNADMKRYQAYDKLPKNKMPIMFMQKLVSTTTKSPPLHLSLYFYIYWHSWPLIWGHYYLRINFIFLSSQWKWILF